MATVGASTKPSQNYIGDSSLETFSLVLLVNSNVARDMRDIEQTLRAVINHLIKFPNVQECKNYIEKLSKIERIVMVVSGRLGQEIVPFIHNSRQVIAIYVYCFDKQLNQAWASKFSKVILHHSEQYQSNFYNLFCLIGKSRCNSTF